MKPGRQTFRFAVVALLIAAIASSFPLDAGVAQTPVPEGDPFTVVLSLNDIHFEPDVLEIPADQDAIVRVENVGAAQHSFVVPTLGIDVQLESGESADVTINAPVGEYPFLCTTPGHKEAGMTGTLRVVDPKDLKPVAETTPSGIDERSFTDFDPSELLPEPQELDGNWTVDREGEWTETDVALQFGADGIQLLREWGWQENAYRDFERGNPERFTNEATHVSVSIHEFDTSDGAATALQPFAQVAIDSAGLDDISVEDLGESARALSGPGIGLNLTVLFVQTDNFLIRVGASSELGDPTAMAVEVAEVILAKGAPAPQISPVATGSPVGSPVAALDDPGCGGLAAYSAQVLAIETDAWSRLVAAFGIEEEFDLFLLDEVEYSTLAEMFEVSTTLLTQVDAPPFAEDWHENQIALRQGFAAVARLVPQAGNFFAAVLLLWNVQELLNDQEQETERAAIAMCPAFETFLSELDAIGGEAEGTSESSPDYSSCEGLERYATDLERATIQAFANRPELVEEFIEFGEGSEEDLLARSPAELLMLAAVFMEVSGEVAKVTPPDYALEWHQSQIMNYGLLADFLKAAASDGFESAEAEFGEQFGIVGILGDAAAEEATDECPVFYEFATS